MTTPLSGGSIFAFLTTLSRRRSKSDIPDGSAITTCQCGSAPGEFHLKVTFPRPKEEAAALSLFSMSVRSLSDKSAHLGSIAPSTSITEFTH